MLTARADAAGARVGEWIDISLEKKVGSSPSVEIHQTGTLIYFTVEVPQDLRNTSPLVERTFYLYRAHEGTVTEIASTTGTVLQGSSNLFSTYLLAYKDKAVGGGDYYSTGERYTAVPPSNNPRTGDDSHLALWLPVRRRRDPDGKETETQRLLKNVFTRALLRKRPGIFR